MTLERMREKDWKVFRELHGVALERFCQRVLDEIPPMLGADDGALDRYKRVYRLMQDRDRELGRLFDDPKRSTALTQLVAIRGAGLLEEEEFARFTEETRGVVERLLELG